MLAHSATRWVALVLLVACQADVEDEDAGRHSSGGSDGGRESVDGQDGRVDASQGRADASGGMARDASQVPGADAGEDMARDASQVPGSDAGGGMARDASQGMDARAGADTDAGQDPDAEGPEDTASGGGRDGGYWGWRIPDGFITTYDPEVIQNQEASCDTGPAPTGIGLACTRGGRECARGLTCTADWRGENGICTILGCGLEPDDCGAESSCCTILQAGGVSLCFPDACRPPVCLEDYQ